MTKNKVAIGVLASGNGSNLQAIIDACAKGNLSAQVVVVISDKPEAKALERARLHSIHHVALSPADFPDRQTFDLAVAKIIREHQVEIIALAGYMRILSPIFIQEFAGRIVNVHPSLLPAFPGLDAIGQAMSYGVKVTGCTVHYVDEGVDTGKPIVQRTVSIHEDDTYETLAARIHVQEHKAFIKALKMVMQTIRGEDIDHDAD